MGYLIAGALAVAILGAWTFGYSPARLWKAGVAKLKALWANFHT